MSADDSSRAAIDCPRCGATVAPDQDWCLKCGAPARTRIVTPPSWRGPVSILAALIALSLAALAVAFVDLTNDPQPPQLVPVPTVTETNVIPAPVAP